MVTRFVAIKEAPVHREVKQKLVIASELDTQLIFRKFNNTARVFKKCFSTKIADIESHTESIFDDVADLV